MKIIRKALCATLLAIPALAAAEGINNCSQVNIGADVLAKFPNAAKACHDVTLKGEGIYMHFVAQVVATDGAPRDQRRHTTATATATPRLTHCEVLRPR